MTPRSPLARALAGLIVGALVVSACGGPAATSGPASEAPATAAPATTAPETQAPVTPAPATEAPATEEPVIDPAAEYDIAPPYTFEPLDPTLAAMFVTAMQESLGAMASLFQFGFRSAVRAGDTEAWVIIMRFPNLPISTEELLDQIAEGASAEGGGQVDSITIDGEPARVISAAEGQVLVVNVVGDDVVMTIGTARKATVDVATAVAEAN